MRRITNNRKPIKEPKDLEGLKIRVPEGDVFAENFKTHPASIAVFAVPWSGPLGYLDEDDVKVTRHLSKRKHFIREKFASKVHLLKMTAGEDGALLDVLLENGSEGFVI